MGLRVISSRNVLCPLLTVVGLIGGFVLRTPAEHLSFTSKDPLLGPRVGLKSLWVGSLQASPSTKFLILAGHADSQGLAGAGTAGEAVDIKGKRPMDSLISDELYWNFLMLDAIVRIGREKGLNISSYDPGVRNIDDGNHPITNWSVGAKHAIEGTYVLEIHFDSYGEYGFGSGLIPAITRNLNSIDESLANSFGRYPMFFRGGLGAPKRGIRILEIGKLEGKLEKGLRDINSRENIINKIALKVVNALSLGVNNYHYNNSNQQLDAGDISRPGSHH
tara:strand:- start:3222 stop:4052 length:831 start_codon:yes stop_codon:yes gene_type:complete